MILRSTSIVLAVERKLITNIIGVMKILVIKCKLGPFAWDQHIGAMYHKWGKRDRGKILLLSSCSSPSIFLILSLYYLLTGQGSTFYISSVHFSSCKQQ
jgi:hypothetical protein